LNIWKGVQRKISLVSQLVIIGSWMKRGRDRNP